MITQKQNLKTKSDNLLRGLYFQNEKIYTGNNGEYIASEKLSRFQDETTFRALNILKGENRTLDLLYLALLDSYIMVGKTNKNETVNAYIKDLSEPNFIEIINTLDCNFSIDKSHITIEILEDNYGELNNTTLNNIKLLQKKGFKISIDDLSLYSGNENNISLQILIKLLNNQIIPDIVKIDGPFLQKVLKKEISENEISVFKNTLEKLKIFGIKVVGEWIQDELQGKQARELGIDYFQGRELKDGFSINTDNFVNTEKYYFGPINLDKEVCSICDFFKDQVDFKLNLVA